MISFFDDFKITDTLHGKGSAHRMFGELVEWLGFLFDPAKDHIPSLIANFLGNEEDLTHVTSGDYILVKPKEGREEHES